EIDLALQEHIKGPVSVQSWFFVQATGHKAIDKGGVQPELVGGFQQESKIWHNSKKHASGCFCLLLHPGGELEPTFGLKVDGVGNLLELHGKPVDLIPLEAGIRKGVLQFQLPFLQTLNV